jgi:hypothetical protein
VDLPFTSKSILRQKEEELWKLKYFTMQKYQVFKINPLKETKILQDIYYNSLTNLKFQPNLFKGSLWHVLQLGKIHAKKPEKPNRNKPISMDSSTSSRERERERESSGI